MNGSEKPFENFDELSRLLSLVCDGELSGEDSARLREILNRSAEARRYFLEYVQLHAELHWAAGMGRQEETAARVLRPEGPLGLELPTPAALRVRKALWAWRWLLVAAGLLVGIGLGLLLVRSVWKPRPSAPEPALGPVAQWGQTSLPQWAPGSATPELSPLLTEAQAIELQTGFAELVLDPDSRLVLEGPARCRLLGPGKIEFPKGRLAAVLALEESPLRIQTPWIVLEGQNSQFGLVVEDGGAGEVHVFSGRLNLNALEGGLGFLLRGDGKPAPSEESSSRPKPRVILEAPQAVRILPPAEKPSHQIELVEILPDLPGFVFRLPGQPWGARIAQFRSAVARHPALIHHYPFEDTTPEQRRQDRRGQLHLVEVVMSGGRGESKSRFMLAPPGADQWAFHPARGLYAGNTIGAALQTEALFLPPENMTIELLVNFGGFPPRQKTPIGALLATRADARRASFFLAVGAEGQLLHLLDAEQPWHEAEGVLIPGEWYYLASTFQANPQNQTTLVNTYLANLTRDEKNLQWVVKNSELRGIPTPGRLGIGKAFDQDGAHAYPWPGLLDEIAIYQTALDRHTLQQHLDILLGKPTKTPQK